MKKYKLIKEYPGSPKLGTIAIHRKDYGDFALNDKYHQPLPSNKIQNYPEFWEEIVEKDYEILSYKNSITGEINFKGRMFLSNDGYKRFSEEDLNRVNHTSNRKVYSIHSVKRLIDGEIFTIDDILDVRNVKNVPLKWINLTSNDLVIGTGYSIVVSLSEINHAVKL